MPRKARDRIVNPLHRAAIIALLRGPHVLPYRARLATGAFLMAWVFAPAAGYLRRAVDNMAYVRPDLPRREARRIARAVAANTGRMLMEMGSPTEFTARLGDLAVTGPGVAELDAALAAGRPIIMVSGHFGNFDAARYAMVRRGHKVGALYRPNDDPAIDKLYEEALASIARPVFPRGRRGLAQMVRFLKEGNSVAILLDQYVYGGAPVTFFGKPAPTSLSAAEMALKYDALLLPAYGIREGEGFVVHAEPSIPHSDAVTMTQAINDSLEAQVRAHMEQWLWIHRRWKPEKTRAVVQTTPAEGRA